MLSPIAFKTTLGKSILLQALVTGILTFFLLLPFIYRCGAGEADSGSMVAGIYQAALAKESILTSPHYYFHTGQPLYNIVFAALVRITRISFDSLLLILNTLAAIGTGLTAASLYYLSRTVGIAIVPTLFGTLVYVAAPYTFELGTYAHPQTLSIALITLSFCLVINGAARFEGYLRKSILISVAAVICGTLGLLIRMDGLVLAPLLLAVMILSNYSWRKITAVAIGLPAAIFLFAQIFRFVIIPDASAPGNLGLLQSLLRFMETQITDGLPSILMTLGTGGATAVLLGVAYATIRGDKRAIVAAAVAIVPLVVYTTQNAHVPRRFIHLFIVAGFGACALYRSYRSAIVVNTGSSKSKIHNKRRPTIKDSMNSSSAITYQGNPWYQDTPFLATAVLVIIGNWILWPAFAATTKAVGDQLPDTKFWRSVTNFIPSRHADQQSYYCWTSKEYARLVSRLSTPHDIIGGWLEYGELLSAFSRAGIQVSKKQIPLKQGRPTLTALTANGVTHYQYSPPWDFPPGQQTPSVVLLQNYGRDVTYGLENISIVAPPPGITYHIY